MYTIVWEIIIMFDKHRNLKKTVFEGRGQYMVCGVGTLVLQQPELQPSEGLSCKCRYMFSERSRAPHLPPSSTTVFSRFEVILLQVAWTKGSSTPSKSPQEINDSERHGAFGDSENREDSCAVLLTSVAGWEGLWATNRMDHLPHTVPPTV